MKNLQRQFSFYGLFIFLLISTIQCNGTGKSAELSLHYLVREPLVESKNPPVIIMLHGWGSNEVDLFGLSRNLPEEYLIISARAPFIRPEGGYAWYQLRFENGILMYDANEAESSRLLLVKFIDEIIKRYHVDSKRVYLLGFSQGAIMCSNMAFIQPEKIHGAIILSGRVMSESLIKISNSEALTNLNVFISHGTKDNVLTLEGARQLKSIFERKAVKLEYHEYNMGHQISEEELSALNIWLKKTK